MGQRVIGVARGVRFNSNRVLEDLRALASRRAAPAGLEPGELTTLEIGSCVVLSTLGVGFQFGRWPAWAALLAVGGYFAWVVVYSEVTFQAKRSRPSQSVAPNSWPPSCSSR